MLCIKSEDIVAICLLLAEGDTTKSVEEIITLVEKYQLEKDRHFGLSREDFRALFYQLGIEAGKISIDDILENRMKKILMEILIQDLLAKILEYEYAYFNDEGEGWIKSSSTEIKEKNHLMRKFFCCQTGFAGQEVMEFLKNNKFNDDILEKNSRPGTSS